MAKNRDIHPVPYSPFANPGKPSMIASKIGSPEDLTAFLNELLDAVQLKPAQKREALQAALDKLPEDDGPKNLDDTIAAAEGVSPESRHWARELIRSEGLPESWSSPIFVDTVAESRRDPAKARRLIAERRRYIEAAVDGPRTVRDIVAGYDAGGRPGLPAGLLDGMPEFGR